MRVTNSMMNNTFMNGLKNNLNQIYDINNKMNTGQQINRPSDNPAKIAKIMNLQNEMKTNEQYNSNIDDIVGWIETTDSALSDIGNSLSRVKELLVSAGNAAYGSDERNAIKTEINQIISRVNSSLNTTYDGKYIFGGLNMYNQVVKVEKDANTGNNSLSFIDEKGNSIDIDLTDPNYNDLISKIETKLESEISPGIKVDYNTSANDIINFTDKNGENNLFNLFDDIIKNLEDPDASLVSLSGSVQSALENVLNKRTEVGAKQNVVESIKSKNEEIQLNLKSLYSENQDIDIAQIWIEYTTAMTSYNATLQAGTKMLQPSIMDYLR